MINPDHKLYALIANDEIELAICELKNDVHKPSVLKDLLLFENQYNRIRRESNLGTLDHETLSIQKNKVVKGLIEIVSSNNMLSETVPIVSEREEVKLIFSATIKKDKMEELARLVDSDLILKLCNLTSDYSLELKKIEHGSIIITIDISREGLIQLKALHEKNILSPLISYPILKINHFSTSNIELRINENNTTPSIKYDEVKWKFINSWGKFGLTWGVNRVMAQIHAVLLISVKPLTPDDIMRTLEISRGNVNTNLRSLTDWGLVYEVKEIDGRSNWFIAEKDTSKMLKKIAVQRYQKEVLPLINDLSKIMEYKESSSEDDFFQLIDNIKVFTDAVTILLNELVEKDNPNLIEFLSQFHNSKIEDNQSE